MSPWHRRPCCRKQGRKIITNLMVRMWYSGAPMKKGYQIVTHCSSEMVYIIFLRTRPLPMASVSSILFLHLPTRDSDSFVAHDFATCARFFWEKVILWHLIPCQAYRHRYNRMEEAQEALRRTTASKFHRFGILQFCTYARLTVILLYIL